LRSECFFVSNGAAAVTCPLPTSRTGHRCARVRAYCSQPKSEHLLTGGVGDVPAWVTRAAPAATARMPSARPTTTIRRLVALGFARSLSIAMMFLDVLIVALLWLRFSASTGLYTGIQSLDWSSAQPL